MSITAINFGVQDRLFCDSCGRQLALVRRTPQPCGIIDGELQTFACTGCSGRMQRSVDRHGAGMPEESLTQQF